MENKSKRQKIKTLSSKSLNNVGDYQGLPTRLETTCNSCQTGFSLSLHSLFTHRTCQQLLISVHCWAKATFNFFKNLLLEAGTTDNVIVKHKPNISRSNIPKKWIKLEQLIELWNQHISGTKGIFRNLCTIYFEHLLFVRWLIKHMSMKVCNILVKNL